MTETVSSLVPETAMPVVTNFIEWSVPEGFETFEVVQKFDGPFHDSDGETVIAGPVEHHFGVGHRAQLSDESWLIVRPGDYDSYSAPGYFLGRYSAAGTWLWGRRFGGVEAALTAAGTELRGAQRALAAARRAYR